MTDNETILVVIDPTAEEQPALARATWLAKALAAPIALFVCDYDQALASHPLFDAEGLEKARQAVLEKRIAELEKLAAPLRAQGFTVTTDASSTRPVHRGIAEKIAATRPRLVVKDTHYHDLLKRTLLSNTDWNLIRSCPVPLLLVKPRPVAAPPSILAAIDPMHEHDKPAELDRAILSFANDLALATGAQLHVLHAFDPTTVLAAAAATPIAMTSVPVAEVIDELERAHRNALDTLLRDFPIAPENVRLVQGAAHHCIAELAEQLRADFVVMGAVSRSALQRVFLGSTAERVLDRLPCDMVVVKPRGFESRVEG